MLSWKTMLCGCVAGIVNGLLGAGGGMILVPMLSASHALQEQEIFPSSVSIILPLCVVSLAVTGFQSQLPWREALPYLLGSIPGGIMAGLWGRKIKISWLHRALGILILWGGIRYLW